MSPRFGRPLHAAWAVRIVFAATLVGLPAWGHARSNVALTAAELIRRYRQAVTCWDTSVAMQVEVVHDWARKAPDQTDIRHWRYDAQHRRGGNRCEWFGRCEFEGELDGETYSHVERFRQVVGDDFVLYYSERDSAEDVYAAMHSTVEESRFMLQAQSPDGGFLQGRIGGIGTAPQIADLMSTCGDLHLVGQEMLDGTSCSIVEARTDYGTYTVWIAPEKGYNALRYSVRKSGHDILRDDVHIDDQGITEYIEVVDAIEVQLIDGVFVPVSGQLTGRIKTDTGTETSDRMTAVRSEIRLHPDFQALRAFEVRFPEGTTVTHRDIPGLEFRWTQGRFVPDMEAYLVKSLVGSPLPSLDGIVNDFDLASATGEMILVCLWDVNQRPARSCITELRDKAKELHQKGIVVVTIQASTIDRTELDRWTLENGIPFATGTIQSKEETARNAWGARSLPWLILTDREHIVVAEGFSIDELDEKRAETSEEQTRPGTSAGVQGVPGVVYGPDDRVVSSALVVVEADALVEWLRQNDVPFGAGTVENDERQTCLNWGVKSLPWLILADRAYVLCAGGFALGELDNEIEALARKESR